MEAIINNEKLKKNEKLVNKYRDFLFSLPGLVCVGYNDTEITISIKPEKVELARQSVPSALEGVPVKIKPRTNTPQF